MKMLWTFVVTVLVLTLAVPLLQELGRTSTDSHGGSAPRDAIPSQPSAPVLRRMLEVVSGEMGPEAGAGEGQEEAAMTLYRWRDEDGSIHIEQTPPPGGAPAERIFLQRPDEDHGSAVDARPSAQRAPAGRRDSDSPLSVYTPAGATEFLDRLGDTVQQLQARQQDLEMLKSEAR